MKAVLFLHGGGSSNHNRYLHIEKIFNNKGIITHAFDHQADSLAGRLREAETELSILKSKIINSKSGIFVWGSSMGGHVACRLVETHPEFAGVILHSAAAYSQVSESLPFGPEFTKVITRTNDWADSPAFKAINDYQGKVMATYGEFDNIIPDGIKKVYIARAQRNGEYHLIKGVGHTQLRPVSQFELSAWHELVNLGLEFILAK